MRAMPRWLQRLARRDLTSALLALDADFAVAEHVLYLAGAAVEGFAGAQAGARAVHVDCDAAAVADARRLGRALGQGLSIDPYGGLAVLAAHVAVEPRGGRGDDWSVRPIRQSCPTARVQRLALFGREEKAADVLSQARRAHA